MGNGLDGIVIFYGMAGAGKSTLGNRLSAATGVPYMSSSDLIRSAAPLNPEIKHYVEHGMPRGELLSDELMNEVLSSYLLPKVILDGFPRTLRQAQMLVDCDVNVQTVVYLAVDEAIARERMLEQRRRADDTPEAVQRRITTFKEHDRALRDFFHKHYHVKTVNTNYGEEPAYISLCRALNLEVE